jgi:hypothetical protein
MGLADISRLFADTSDPEKGALLSLGKLVSYYQTKTTQYKIAQSEREPDHSPLTAAEIRTSGSIHPLPHAIPLRNA